MGNMVIHTILAHPSEIEEDALKHFSACKAH